MAEDSTQHGGTAVLEPDVAPPQRKPMPGWAVLLHNDDVNEFAFVARSVVEFARLSATEAAERTVEAHESGVALLLVTHRERAELMQEQFETRGLTVTIEPAA
jgi:ATP-dependent Clp protease adapter protein ClpS